MSGSVDLKALLQAGAHFGHKTSRWHPKMAPYIYGKRGDNHIINLDITVTQIEDAMKFAESIVAIGHQILFVGTKRQSKECVKLAAEEAGQPYVVERWYGGTLTNSNTVNARVKKLKDLESKMASGELVNKYSKLEVQRFQEQIDDMNFKFGGIKELHGKPGALFIADINEDEIAVKEAKKLGIPVIAIVDTNTDPTLIDYPMASNDDAIKAITLICDYIKAAILSGQQKRTKKSPEEK